MTTRDTDIIHAGEGLPVAATPVTTPIYSATTFVFPSAAELERFQQGDSDHYIYTRYANPTVQAVEAKIAAAEGGEAAMITGSQPRPSFSIARRQAEARSRASM